METRLDWVSLDPSDHVTLFTSSPSLSPQRRWGPLWESLSESRRALFYWGGAALALGISSALLAFCVGPLLRVIFGGERLSWSPLMEQIWGPPPPLDQVQSALPWLIAGIALIKAISFYIERITRGMIARQAGRHLRSRLLNWASQLSEDERLSLGQDEVRARVTVDVERVERWLEGAGAGLLRDGVQVILLGLSAILVSGWAGVLILSVYPLLITPIIWASRRLKRAARQELSTAHHLGRWAAYVEAHLSRIQATKRQRDLREELAEHHQHLEQTQARLAHLQGLAPSFTELSVSLIIAGSLAGFTWGLAREWWSAEELMSLFVCILMLYAPVKSLGRAQQQWVIGRAALERVSLPIAEPRFTSISLTGCDRVVARRLQPLRGGAPCGQALTFDLKRGELTGVIGGNGSGKSSLLLALAGLVPARGSLMIMNDQPTLEGEEHLPPNEPYDEHRYLFSQVSWGGQPSRLLTSELQTLMNGSYQSASQITELLRALKVDLDELRVPQRGSEALNELDERAAPLHYWDWFQGLSSGERQRVTLATLLAQPSELLLLDEPEAHLDEEGVETLVELLRAVSHDRFVCIATHSESLILACDQVIQLHEELP